MENDTDSKSNNLRKGDNVGGDKIGQDKIGGDKIGRDKITNTFFNFGVGPPKPPSGNAELLQSQGTEAQIKGDLGDALQKLKRAQEINPDLPRIDSQIREVEDELKYAPYVDRTGLVDKRRLWNPLNPNAPQAKSYYGNISSAKYYLGCFVFLLTIILLPILITILLPISLPIWFFFIYYLVILLVLIIGFG